MLSGAQNTFHHNPPLRGPVSSKVLKNKEDFFSKEQQKQFQNVFFHAEGLKDELIHFKRIS